MTSLVVSQTHSDVLHPGRKLTVSGNAIVNIDVEGSTTKKVVAAGDELVLDRFLNDVKVDVTALGDVTVTEAVDDSQVLPTEVITAKVVETEHVSPNQYGGYFGKVYRQYHGAKLTTETITATGITKLIAAGGRYEATKCYNGDQLDGTNSLIIAKGTDEVVFTITGAGAWTCDEGWVDYVK